MHLHDVVRRPETWEPYEEWQVNWKWNKNRCVTHTPSMSVIYANQLKVRCVSFLIVYRWICECVSDRQPPHAGTLTLCETKERRQTNRWKCIFAFCTSINYSETTINWMKYETHYCFPAFVDPFGTLGTPNSQTPYDYQFSVNFIYGNYWLKWSIDKTENWMRRERRKPMSIFAQQTIRCHRTLIWRGLK